MSDGADARSLPEYRVFASDTHGRLFRLYTASQKLEPVELSGVRYGPATACQELVTGQVEDATGKTFRLLAIARKSGSIDLVRLPDAPNGSTKDAEQPTPKEARATKLACSVKEERMRVGVERWVGLCFTKTGLVSATSSGAFRYLELSNFTTGEGGNDSERITLDAATDEELDAASYKWTVPGPLHQVTFFSATSDAPTHFAYGGEQVPLSLWSINAAIQHVKEPKMTENGGDASKVQENAESAPSQGSKRKKASGGKHRELLPGELWRAKNLPNDSVSLPRYPLIRAVAFLPGGSRGESDENTPADDIKRLGKTRVAVGTKDGLVRVYEPGSGSQKHTHEWPIAPKDQGAVRTMALSEEEKILFVGTATRNLYAVDSESGRVLFQYKDIHGAVSSVLVLPPVQEGEQAKSGFVLAAALDRLVRFLDTGAPRGNGQRTRGSTLCTYFAGLENIAQLTLDEAPAVQAAEKDDADDVWNDMSIISEGDGGAQASQADDNSANETSHEPRSKRRKS